MKISYSPKPLTDSNFENNIAVPYGATKRAAPKFRWIIILLIVTSPFIFLLGKIALEWIFVTSPGVVWMEPITINALEAGTIKKVNFKRGDMVNGGDVLFTARRRLPDGRIEAIAMLEAERDAGVKFDGVNVVSAVSSSEMGILSQNVAYYAQARNSIRSLMSKGAATRAELDLAENNLRQAQIDLRQAQTASQTALEGIPVLNPLRIEQVEQSIERLKSIASEDFAVTSAIAAARISSILVAEGQSFAEGEPLAILADPGSAHIVTYVDPHDSDNIEFDQTVTIQIIGTGRKIRAAIIQMPVLASDVPDGVSEKLYPITMRGIQVFLKPIDELQVDELIDGLPVVVNW